MSHASTLQSHIGYKLRLVSNAVSQSFAKKLLTYNVTVAEWVILRNMYDNIDVVSSCEMANITGLTRGAVSKLIERLVNKELVIRDESKVDRRYQEIQLSTLAKELVPKLTSVADENDNNFFDFLEPDEQNDLIKILDKLAKKHSLKINPIK